MTGVVTSVAWADPEAVRLREALVAELRARYADLFASRPDLVAAGDEIDAAAVVHTAVVRVTPDGPPAGHAAIVRRADGELEVKRVYVAPGWRRRGLSAALMLHLEDAAAALGAHRLVLATGPLQPEAAALYAGLGYVRVPHYGPPAWDGVSLAFAKPVAAREPA